MKCKSCNNNGNQPIKGYHYCESCVKEQRSKAQRLLKRHSDMKGFKLQDEIKEDKPNRARNRSGVSVF